ncbi:MAG: ATP-binding cassette domain-containing protein [Acidimicrobiia bacterium]|nr:ATP-binding cassette domain-containing protein [Acidimicrobiia bacterium]
MGDAGYGGHRSAPGLMTISDDGHREVASAPMSDQSAIHVETAGRSFGTTSAFRDVSFSVASESFAAIVGASGSGKTTLLRCIAGLEELTSGQVQVLGRPVEAPSSRCVYVFQDYRRSLFPWRTVVKNVSFPLEMSGVNRTKARQRAIKQLEIVGLDHRADAFTWQLSGGMQQRVAIARALAADPEILLMDEPFGAVDAQTRMELQLALLDIWRRLGKTILFVTHDIDEALFLADRILVLDVRGDGLALNRTVRLPRPRSHTETPALPEFTDLRSEVLQILFQSNLKDDD